VKTGPNYPTERNEYTTLANSVRSPRLRLRRRAHRHTPLVTRWTLQPERHGFVSVFVGASSLDEAFALPAPIFDSEGQIA